MTKLRGRQTFPPVLRLIKYIALLLVAQWLPATLHCQLESAGLEALFACADQSTHTDRGDCTGDDCQILESGQIIFSKSRFELAALPALTCVCVSCCLHIALPAPVPEIFASHQDETLPLQRTWQFVRRAALPARAPDTLIA